MSDLRGMMRDHEATMAAKVGAAPAPEAARLARSANRRHALRVTSIAAAGILCAGAIGGGVAEWNRW